MKCTCGSSAVNSDRHSTWCDIDKVPTLAIDELVRLALLEAGKTYLYIIGRYKLPDRQFENVKANHYKDWRYASTVSPLHCSLTFSNGSSVHILNEQELYNFHASFEGVMLEDQNDIGIITNHIQSLRKPIWIDIVDTVSEQLIEGF